MADGLVTAADFPGLVPDIGRAVSQGMQIGRGIRDIRLGRQQEREKEEIKGRLEEARGVQERIISGMDVSDKSLGRLASLSPEMFESAMASTGLIDQRKRNEAANFAFDLERTPAEQRMPKIQQRVKSLIAQGRDPRDTVELSTMPLDEQNEVLKLVQLGALTPEDRLEFFSRQKKVEEAGLADVQSSEFLPGGGTRIVRKDGTVEVVQPTPEEIEIIRAGEDRGVDLQQRRAKGRGLGTGTAKIANNALDLTEKMRSNNSKLRKVIAEVRGGAETGPLANNLPSFRASTLRLIQIKNELGLDVIGAVTFGALSEGEMQFAMDTALPTRLEGPELVRWAQEKIAAQEKLAEYFEDQAIFLSKPGNTAADWLELGRTRKEAMENQADTQQPAGQSIGRFQIEVVQ
jgi:hypothetical protein